MHVDTGVSVGALLNCSAPFLVCYLRQFLNGIWSLKVPKLAGQNSAKDPPNSPPHAGTITLPGLYGCWVLSKQFTK